MAELAAETKDMGFQLEQVQDFTPTPMTVATVIYYSGVHPYTLRPVYTAKTREQKQNQHRFFFWHKREEQGWIKTRLQKLGRNEIADKLLGNQYQVKSNNSEKNVPEWLQKRRGAGKKS